MTDPLVSVIIPVHNGEPFLRECLDSILAQGERALEVIVIDDGSTDGSAALVKSHEITPRYLFQPNAGYANAVNRGLAQAEGRLLAILDADDVWCENKLELQLPILLANPQIDLVVGNFSRFWSDQGGKKHYLPAEKSMNFGASLFRASLLTRVGPLNTKLPVHADFDWFMRAREMNVGIYNHDDVVLYYRRHGDNVSANVKDTVANSAMMEMLRMSLNRRRDTGKDLSLKAMKASSPVVDEHDHE